MLSALGTLAAIILSLFLSMKENKPKLDVFLSVDNHFKKTYQIGLTKNPLNVFTIKEVGYICKLKKRKYEGDVCILNSQGIEISRYLPIDFSSQTFIRLMIDDEFFSNLTNEKVRFYVKDVEGRIYKSNKILIKEL